jgi:hypothetical protein
LGGTQAGAEGGGGTVTVTKSNTSSSDTQGRICRIQGHLAKEGVGRHSLTGGSGTRDRDTSKCLKLSGSLETGGSLKCEAGGRQVLLDQHGIPNRIKREYSGMP